MAEIKDIRQAPKAQTWGQQTEASIPTNMAAEVVEIADGEELRAGVDAMAGCAVESAVEVSHKATAAVRIDEVFQHITAFRAIVDNQIPESSLLGRSLRAQANAIFNQAFFNLQARFGFAEVYVDTPGNGMRRADTNDITDVVVHEVLRLQRILK
ncbi:MAG: hypothetical protein L6Q71_02545 [Planctomycetes bacterium]|nr:hypothetical protein [Planctomycetota bacterium]NUQ34402.1 hypothetical protein [Planctomycetaceae bacterium]